MLSFRILHESPLLRITDVRCRCAKGGAGAEEHSAELSVAIARHGVFVRHIGRDTIVADTNVASIFRPGVAYRVSHPCDGGDDCTSITPAPEVVRELLDAIEPKAQDRGPEFDTIPCPAAAFATQSAMVRLLRRPWPEALEIDEIGVRLLRALLGAVYGPARERSRDAGATGRAHRDLAERAKAHLATHLDARLDLASVSRAAHASPCHLSRVFTRQTGETLSRYLLRLRVRRAASEILDGEASLAAVAARAGFCDQSHLTNACRREFGLTPGELFALDRRRIREMSKLIQEDTRSHS